jgi:hypothetical protein
MFAEEEFLRSRFGSTFENWAAVTPTILPDLHLWKASDLPFSWRRVLRREYTGLFVLTTTFTVLEIAGDWIAERHLQLDLPWLILATFGGLAYLVLRSLKKQTRLLDETGR